jgi:arylsulfatase A-like enzyme
MNMGHHGVCGKGNGTWPLNMYETSVKVPGLVSRPGRVPRGVVCRGLYSHYDVLPTLLDYVGVENPIADQLPGRSFAPLLEGEPDPGNEQVVIFDEYGPVRMVRTREWKYVHRYPEGPHELWDLVNDPDEETNLYGRPEHAARVEEMRARLGEWFRRYGVAERDGTRTDCKGRGQFELTENAAEGGKPFAQHWCDVWWREGYEPPQHST